MISSPGHGTSRRQRPRPGARRRHGCCGGGLRPRDVGHHPPAAPANHGDRRAAPTSGPVTQVTPPPPPTQVTPVIPPGPPTTAIPYVRGLRPAAQSAPMVVDRRHRRCRAAHRRRHLRPDARRRRGNNATTTAPAPSPRPRWRRPPSPDHDHSRPDHHRRADHRAHDRRADDRPPTQSSCATSSTVATRNSMTFAAADRSDHIRCPRQRGGDDHRSPPRRPGGTFVVARSGNMCRPCRPRCTSRPPSRLNDRQPAGDAAWRRFLRAGYGAGGERIRVAWFGADTHRAVRRDEPAPHAITVRSHLMCGRNSSLTSHSSPEVQLGAEPSH